LLLLAPLFLTGCHDATDDDWTDADSSGGYCVTAGCNLTLAYDRSAAADAQLLMQATFGPTDGSLAELAGASDYASWIHAQFSLPATSHREYYRARVNSHLVGDVGVGVYRLPCQAGSRWNAFAFGAADKGKRIVVTGDKVYVGGLLRTQIDPLYTGNGVSEPSRNCTNERSQWMINKGFECVDQVGYRGSRCASGSSYWTDAKLCQQSCYDVGHGYVGDDCSPGWASLEFDGYLCGVEEEVGGWVGLSSSSDCDSWVGQQNPAIWFSGSAQSVGGLAFQKLKAGVLLLAETVVPCPVSDFVYHEGQHYLHDPRLALVRNDLGAPSAGSTEACPVVARTFLNEGSCQVQSACGSTELDSTTMVRLNETSFQLFLDVAGKYVYSVTGLQADGSPCGVMSRWERLDASATATALSADDEQAVVAALEAEGGWLRDVYVQCESVAAGAIVEVDGDLFQHVHIHEHNVYDFSEWVGSHPGGAEPITRWTSHGFEIEFPSNHPMSRWPSQFELGFLGRLDDSVDFLGLPVSLQTQELALAFGAGSQTIGFQVCGSPGEVASDPAAGHHFSFYVDEPESVTDLDYDYPRAQEVDRRLSKSTVWASVALHSQDQLRQRMAWALSQVLVVSTAGLGQTNSNELWVNYYDIFVRNAFGNYRDLLREVTYSPVRGDYLSYRDSKSLDRDGSYPDENYAREIMQLFSIGLWELHLDGTRKADTNGNAIPTYTNEHITNFARVFTGFTNQAKRANIEDGWRNQIDPMQMYSEWHDVYPKQNLNGGYLGDGYPLCADLPARAFLSAGARFEFIGHDYADANVLEVSPDSALHAALLPFKPTLVLTATLECHGDECSADSVGVIKVSGGYYEYVPPTCVHFYFFNGQVIAPGGDDFRKSWKQKCAHPDTLAAGTSCCDGCTNEATTWMDDNNYTCEEPYSWMFETGCRHQEHWASNKYCQLACWENGAGYDGDNCSAGSFISERACGYFQEKVRFSTASAICEKQGLHVCDWQTSSGTCGLDDIFVWTPHSCSVDIEVHADGTVSSQMDSKSMQNKVSVQWSAGYPTAGACPGNCTASTSGCLCPITVEARAVFDQVPSKAQLREALKIGAHAPGSSHSCLAPCSGDVKAYVQAGEGIDVATIFECEGAYFKNAESTVSVEGYNFRNPPVFMLGATLAGREETREALAEVESLLDHLFFHDNTPPFLAHRLIQRLTTSNPSPEYVRDVALAFSQGQFGGTVYSGEYGDLRAAVAAILLHPEARGQRPVADAGLLREPMIKIMHFMRAMEYRDATAGRLDVLMDLQDDIGQFPYETPWVFNYYSPEFQPTDFTDGKVAPEFEIFTPPLALNWLNGMLSLVEYGLSQCDEGIGYHTRSCLVPEGSITWTPTGNSSEMLEELSLLLTGGRLVAAEAIADSLEGLADEARLKAALQAVLMSAEFHTLGDASASGLRADSEPETAPEPDSYKAMVMLYLSGGADTFNMLVPLCGDLYGEYVAVRGDIALAQSELEEISASTQACTSFGVHHKLPFVKQLYDDGQLAFVSNIGSLVEPTTKEQYEAKTSQNCVGLYSHVDQTNGAQTLKCRVQGTSPRGFGGRLADTLAGEDYLTTSFSIAGMTTWSQGIITNVEIISSWGGAVRLQNYQDLRAVVGNTTQIKYGGAYAEEYTKKLADAVHSSETLGGYLDEVALVTEYDTSTGLAKQLNQVARLIATRTARKAERDFFYVQLGGFDTHDNNNAVLEDKFTEISTALEGFVAELKGQDIFESTVMVTSSEFGRTLTSNGLGTDHAWAGNHFVLGGGIRGGKIFNDFPESLLEGNGQDAGRGRMIPKYPWESVMAPIAEWMGAAPWELTNVFPNLANFDSSEHIIGKTELFSNYDLV
jgi:cullin-associated NEDD8-dissociated protein 1